MLSAGSLAGRSTDFAYSTAWRLVRTLPESMAVRLFRQAADLTTRRNGPSIRQFRLNLSRVSGLDPRAHPAELDDLVRRGMRSYARYWLETFRLPSMNVAETVGRIHTDGANHLDEALAKGRGAILALPHSGNWDVAGLWLVERGNPFATVAERLKPESLFDKFVAYRESLGMEVLALTGGPQPPMSVLRQRLAAGRVVCLVADRDLSRSGVEVEFFGETARMPAGPAMLAATTGAALLPVHLYFTTDGWGQWIAPPVDLGEGNLRAKLRIGTQALATAFAERIALHPEDWHMLHRLWLADLVQLPENSADGLQGG
ncbi:phosphatidylinositol mannoside acyltransferase [Jatrophihabitans sp. DSM 45814]